MSKYRPTSFGKEVTVGYGWVARWEDGTLGYLLPNHLGSGTNTPAAEDWVPPNEEMVLCKITVEVQPRKDGRLTTRKLSSL